MEARATNPCFHLTYTVDENNNVVEQTDGTNTIKFVYDSDNSPIYMEYKGVIYYYEKNLQGDIVAILDANGNTVVEYTYDIWGKLVSITGALADTIGVANPLRYRGYYYDTEIELYYLQSRYYSPDLMRFISQDDAVISNAHGEPIGSNLYAYCLNNPCNNSDLLGCGPWAKYLTLWDYKRIHNMVADAVRDKIGILKASREVYVKGDKGRGFLDVYDKTKNQYYEIKSIGSAELKSTKKQMEKYDASKVVLGRHGKVKRGTKKISGSLYYGAWKIKYYSYKNGLVVYTHDWIQKRYDTAAKVVSVAILVGITALTIASSGSAAPAYGLVFV